MSDELDIRAQVTLEADEAASVKQIKSQIPNIESGLKNTRVKVSVEADTSNVVQEVQKAAKTAASSLKTGGKVLVPIDAAFNINLKDTNAVEREVNRLIRQFTQNKGTLIDFKIKANGVNEANSVMLKYKNSAQETISTMLKLVDVTQDLDNPQFAWQINSNVFDKNLGQLDKAKDKLLAIERAANLLKEKLPNNVSLNFDKVTDALKTEDLAQATAAFKELRYEYDLFNAKSVKDLPSSALESLPKKITEVTANLAVMKNAFAGLQAKGALIPDGVETTISNLSKEMHGLSSAKMDDKALNRFKEISAEASRLQGILKESQSEMRFDNIVKGVERADVQLKRFQQNMLLLKKEWSSFTKDPELMKQFNDLYSASQAPGAAQNLSVLNAQMGVLKTNIELAGKAQKGFMGRLAQNFSKFVSWFAIGGFTASAVRGFRDIFAAVKDVDSAMTSLRKVTDETDKTYSRFLTNASKKAVQLGASVRDIVSATTSFARLGYSIEDSYSLGQLATVYANVGDEVNGVEGATSSIISTLAGFKLGVQDATSVVDKFNNVGNNFAITSGGIGEALKRSASALNEAGADIDSAIALITGANTVVQDVDTVGTALKTSSLRLRGSTTELEDMGEDVDSFAKSTSLLRGELEALTGVDIMINDNQYKDIYTIYEEIAKVYDSLTDVSQANVLEILFGKRQANVGAAILSGWDTVASAYETSLDSEGSAAREYEKWLSSIEAKQQQAKAQFQAFSNAILDSDLIKFVYDSGTGILGFLTSITETLGSLPLLATAAAAALSFKNVG